MKERDEWEEGIAQQKELTHDDLGGSQTVQITKDAKIRKFISGKACSGEDVAGEPVT